MKYFRHRIVFLVRKKFSDETFSSLKVKKKNQIGLLVTKFFVTRTFSDGPTMTNEIALQQNVFLVTKKFVTKSPVFRH